MLQSTHLDSCQDYASDVRLLEHSSAATSSSPATAAAPGGFFIGTVPDGKAVLALLRNQPEYRVPMLKLAKRWNVSCAIACLCAWHKKHLHLPTCC